MPGTIGLGRGARRLALPILLAALLTPSVPAVGATRVVEYTYSTQSRGTFASGLDEFDRVVAATLNDSRGWSLGGTVRFREVPDEGDFRLWLAADALVPTFGGPCTTFYSCQPGRDVVINELRWRTGSPYWPGPVDEYRRMVLNHEVGHWLGFRHSYCSGGAAPAPIMMQQSKGVGACRPNPWPTAEERRLAAAARGLEILDAPPPPPPPPPVTVTAIAALGGGYALARSDGEVAAFAPESLPASGAIPGRNGPVIALAARPAGTGYWLVAADGGVFAHGAPYFGSAATLPLNSPIVAAAATPTGTGYWLIAADGGIFTYGDATYHGSGTPRWA